MMILTIKICIIRNIKTYSTKKPKASLKRHLRFYIDRNSVTNYFLPF